MLLSDLKIILFFVLLFAAVIFTSAIFGLKGTYFILGLSVFFNGCGVVFVLIANGKL